MTDSAEDVMAQLRAKHAAIVAELERLKLDERRLRRAIEAMTGDRVRTRLQLPDPGGKGQGTR
jgi:hypothetical protein